ncbi:MAG: nucleotidyltransferase domain-containing protein [Patescibacteria group bacterium]|jgi:predicted nucleotidyltransferase
MVKKRISKKIINSINAFVKDIETDNIPVKQVYLFGSYAKGTQHRWSDVDVCIISAKFKQPWQALQYLWQKRPKNLDPMIEPVGFCPKDFSVITSSLVAEIKQNGVRIV